ncbi:hypothetical protein [Nonomuraea cavernae]|uniref:hypothetical protein n=1 Tax=Nonomuraea cavernae TaxID=2045107 RepID=UPI0033CCF2BA
MVFFNRGLMVGGTCTGVLLLVPASLVQAVVPPVACLVVLLGFLAVCVGCDTRIVPWRLPQNARQVPSDIIVRAEGQGAFQFGFEMGTGLRTYVPAHIPHALVAVALLGTPWWLAPLLGLSFGAGRTIMVFSSVLSGDATAWDKEFARHRTAILSICWIAVLIIIALLFRGGAVR